MLKKFIWCFTTSLLCFNIVFANEVPNSAHADKQELIPLSAPLYGSIQKSNIAKIQEEYNKAFDDDQRIALYLKTPYEKRQYVFPMIHAAPFISHKIKTHPEIIIWKNKKPTVIAPLLKEFATEHLDNLSPFFYVYLDPDFWNPSQPEKNKTPYSFNNPYAMMQEKTADYVFPTIQQIFKLSDKNPNEYLKTTLSEDDIINISNIIANLDSYQPANSSFRELAIKLTDIQRTQVNRAIADPFKMFVKSLKTLNEDKSFAEFIKIHGFNSLEEFALKGDLIFKSFQILNLHLNAAIEINHLKFDQKETLFQEKEFGTKDINPFEMYIRMHQAKSGDVYFVKQHLSKLSNFFKTNFIEMGIIILID